MVVDGGEEGAQPLSLVVDEALAGLRLDQGLSALLEDVSRSRLTRLIRNGAVRVDGELAKPNRKLIGGECLSLCLTEEPGAGPWLPESLPLSVVFEDEHVLVLDKPAGLVVHPAVGHWSGTLVNGLLHRFADAQRLPRAGIVHRLDKDTSGLMVVARSFVAHGALVDALSVHAVERVYWALVQGDAPDRGSVEAPIGRHPGDRKRMAVVSSGKRALSHFECLQRRQGLSLVAVRLETGRTHQIRVHMQHLGMPLVGDPIYGRRLTTAQRALVDAHGLAALEGFQRQALHAKRLSFSHPVTGAVCAFEVDLPVDYSSLLASLGFEPPVSV